MTNIDEVLAKLNPKTAALFRRASEIEMEMLPTPSLGINIALGGGLRYGQIHMLWGNRSGSKSSFCLALAANAQKEGKSVAWIDSEKNFDPEWARRQGANPDEIIVSQVASIAEMADASVELIRGGVDLLVVDSISALLPQSYFDNGEIKNLENTGQIGTFSKNIGAALNMMNSVNLGNTCVVLISQVRNNIGSYGASKTWMGGEAVGFLTSTIIKMWSNPNEKEAIMGKVHNGDLIINQPIGRPCTWTLNKARGKGMNMTNDYDFYFAGEDVGVDVVGEILDFALEYGLATRAGAWFYIGDEKFQGRPKAVEFLKENPTIADELYTKIMAAAG